MSDEFDIEVALVAAERSLLDAKNLYNSYIPDATPETREFDSLIHRVWKLRRKCNAMFEPDRPEKERKP